MSSVRRPGRAFLSFSLSTKRPSLSNWNGVSGIGLAIIKSPAAVSVTLLSIVFKSSLVMLICEYNSGKFVTHDVFGVICAVDIIRHEIKHRSNQDFFQAAASHS